MNYWKVILATLVIFGAGVLTGGLLVTYSDSVQRHPHKEGPRKTAAGPALPGLPHDNRPPIPQNFLMRTNLLDRLDHELKLDAVQRDRIEKVIHEGQERIKRLYQTLEPDLHGELADAREKIHAVLSPEQQPQFVEFFKHRPARDHAVTNVPPSTLPATNSVPAGKPD